MIQVRPTILSDALAIRLRPEDEEEALLYRRGPPPSGLLSSIEASAECYTFLDEAGEVIAIFGMVLAGTEAHPWLMSSSRIERHRKAAVRMGRGFVQEMRHHPGYLTCNYIGKQSVRNRAFVEALGFRIVPCPTGDFDLFYLPNV